MCGKSHVLKCLDLIGRDVVKKDEMLECSGHSFILHIDYFLDETAFAENRFDLCLFQDVVNCVDTHGVVEANVSDVEVHACQKSSQPFLSVSCPDTDEPPLLALNLVLWAEVHLHNSACELADVLVHITPG